MAQQVLLPFNYKRFGDQYLAVNLVGSYSRLNKTDFSELVEGKSSRDDLRGVFYLNDTDTTNSIIEEYRRKKKYLNNGTSLFIFVLTNKCNCNCVYCQASRVPLSRTQCDMSKATAKKALDLILSFPNREIVIEFQGGEPLLNFETLRFIVEYSAKFKAQIKFVLVSNLLNLADEQLEYLIKNNVCLCTSLDGPEDVHNSNRPITDASNGFMLLETKLKLLKTHRVKVDAIQTTTKKGLRYSRESVDQYIDFGFDSIFLRPLSPFGFAKNNSDIIGYSPYEFLEFYQKSLDYIIALNRKGTIFKERTASLFLAKILSGLVTNYMDLRSPCGAVIGQMAINYDGNVYTCDEGRMLGESGDHTFLLGNVESTSYHQLYTNDISKLVCLASCAESSPLCNQCVYLPYCGTCPVVNYSRAGNMFKTDPYRCIVNRGILDILFSYLLNDEQVMSIFERWVN